MMKFFSRCSCNQDVGLFILRLIVGAIFLSHGVEKFYYMQDTMNFFAQVGIPTFFAYVVAAVETLGGILLIVGFFTRYVAVLLGVVMLVAIFAVKWPLGYDAGGFVGAWRLSEVDLALLGANIALFFTGAGSVSLTKWCKCRCHHVGASCKVCDAIGCNDGKCDHSETSSNSGVQM